MDIQSLIRLAHQADLEGNFRVADKLTERAIREAANRLKKYWQNKGLDFGNKSNQSVLNELMDTATEGTADAVTKGRKTRQRAGDSFNEFLSREKGIEPAKISPVAPEKPNMTSIRRKRETGIELTPAELAHEQRYGRPRTGPSANATGTGTGTGVGTGGNVGDINAEGGRGGKGGKGGAGGAGGNATGGSSTSGAAAQGGSASSASGAQSNNAVGVGVRNDITTQNQNIMGGAYSNSGGNTMIQNVKTPSNWPGVLAGAAAAGGAGYLGYLLGKDGRPVAPAPNARPGDFKANQLSERAQAHQMGNAQAAQNFIESNRGNPKFKSAQDFYYAAQAAGMSQADMNQIAALAKAEGFRDKTPMMN